MKSFYEAFISNIKYYREKRGYSQAKLAELSNCSNGMIGLIEAGKTKPSFDLLVEISCALNIHPADLFLRGSSVSKSEMKKQIETVLMNDIHDILEKHF